MDALLPTPEDFEFAEERRLFYVAITRAKKRSYLIADMASSSVFINELLTKDDYDIELNEFDITQDQKITQNFYCIKCQTGIMQPKVNQKNQSTFYGCSHYSLCKHTENGCVECGSLMIRVSENNTNYKVLNIDSLERGSSKSSLMSIYNNKNFKFKKIDINNYKRILKVSLIMKLQYLLHMK